MTGLPSSGSLSSGSTDSDIIVSIGSSPSVSISMVKEEKVPVGPQEFKELLLSQEKQTAMAFFLLLITGLPQCGKSGAIQKFLEFFQKTPNRSPPQHGLSFYQLAAVEDAVPGRLHIKALGYSEMTSEDCYVYAMKLAMKQVVAGKPIRYKESGSIPADQFRNHDLNVHFREMFSQLKKAEARTWVSQNMALFNVWDIGHSRTVYHFLPALHGLLSHSYSWLFFDLQRDSQNLYKPPAVPADENFMKWRPRLHYLIRAAKLNLPTQKKVCTMFAMNNEKLQETECRRIIRSVTPNFKNTAKQIGVKEIIDFNNIVTTIDRSNDRTCIQEITKHMDSMVFEAFEDKISMPFSFLFLRSFYHKKNDLVYVKKQEITELAEELGISAERFCELFTSYGSIIDVSLVDPNSNYVILKPNVFIEELNKVFYTDDPVLANTGILRMSFAQETFESHAQAYMDIFVSFGLAVKLARERIELPPTLNVEDNSTVLYLPDIRRTPPLKDDTELRPNVLRLLRSWNAPLGHLQVSFVAKFLESHEEAKLCILEDSPTNLTKIKALDTKNEIEVIFDVVCLGYTLEFRIEKENEEIFTQIVDTCHTLMEPHVTTRYSFAIMCSKDPIIKAKYELTRERHLLPYETLCDECMIKNRVQDPILAMWNKVVKVSTVYSIIL